MKEAEVQTELIDTKVAVKWGEDNNLPLPTSTVVLKLEVGPAVKYFPVNNPAMSSPAPWGYHPFWGLGKLEDEGFHIPDEDDDVEYISYRFDANKVHTGGKRKT